MTDQTKLDVADAIKSRSNELKRGARRIEKVNHPKHYNLHPSGVECIQIVRHMNFNLGNVVKYIWRAGLKSSKSTVEDLKKARFYLDDEIQRIEGKT